MDTILHNSTLIFSPPSISYAWAEDKEHCEEYGRMLQVWKLCYRKRNVVAFLFFVLLLPFFSLSHSCDTTEKQWKHELWCLKVSYVALFQLELIFIFQKAPGGYQLQTLTESSHDNFADNYPHANPLHSGGREQGQPARKEAWPAAAWHAWRRQPLRRDPDCGGDQRQAGCEPHGHQPCGPGVHHDPQRQPRPWPPGRHRCARRDGEGHEARQHHGQRPPGVCKCVCCILYVMLVFSLCMCVCVRSVCAAWTKECFNSVSFNLPVNVATITKPF